MAESTKQIAERVAESCAGLSRSNVSFAAADLHRLATDYLTIRKEAKPMDRSRAAQIVARCLAHVYYRMGAIDEPPASIEEYSLRELLDANHLIAGPAGTTRNEDGTESIAFHCDDRLVAALYTLYHYQGEPPDGPEPIVGIDGKALFCVQVPTEASCDKRGDPDNPCSLYREGTPSPDAACMGDGHYMCELCDQKYDEADDEEQPHRTD